MRTKVVLVCGWVLLLLSAMTLFSSLYVPSRSDLAAKFEAVSAGSVMMAFAFGCIATYRKAGGALLVATFVLLLIQLCISAS